MSDLVKLLRGEEPWVCQVDSVAEVRCGRGDCKCIEAMREIAADEIERLREDMQRIAFNALKRHMILGDSREKYIQMMEANNNAALWQCLEYVGNIAKAAFEGKE